MAGAEGIEAVVMKGFSMNGRSWEDKDGRRDEDVGRGLKLVGKDTGGAPRVRALGGPYPAT
jgi:hypothetical protein